MKMLLNLSIKNKLILIILMVTTFTIGIGFIVITINDINNYKNQLLNDTKITAQLIGEYCIVPLTFGDEKVVIDKDAQQKQQVISEFELQKSMPTALKGKKR